ncbi:MAG: hypothetical protein B7X06_02315, partial [Verrucomicrobia bacterium 21-51-4]
YSILLASFIVLAILAFFMKNVGVRESLLNRSIGRPDPIPTPVDHRKHPRWSSPSACILVIGLLISTQWTTYAWYAWRKSYADLQPFWTVKWPIQYPDFKYTEISNSIQDTLFYATGVNPSWSNSDGKQWLAFYFQWDSPQAAQLAGYHNPQRCMPAVGWIQQSKGEPIFWQKKGVTLVFNIYVFTHNEETVYVFNCQWDCEGYPFYTKIDREYDDRIRDIWIGNTQEGKQVLEVILSGYKNTANARAAFEEWLDRSIQVEALPHSADVELRMPQYQPPSTDSANVAAG